MPKFSFPPPLVVAKLSALTGGLGRWRGVAALCIPCESHIIAGARDPVWYRFQGLVVPQHKSILEQHINVGTMKLLIVASYKGAQNVPEDGV